MYYISILLLAMALYFGIIGFWHNSSSQKLLSVFLLIAAIGTGIVIFLALTAQPQ
jgi:hypothetical protein